MRRSTIVLSVAAVLVLGAGVVVGRLVTELKKPAPQANHGRGWFIDTLDLSPEQRQHMDAIWADVKQQAGKLGDRRHEIDHERDAAIKALLSPEQSLAYDKIFETHRAQRGELDKEREKLFHEADDRSRALLTPAQLQKWESMSKEMHDHHGPPGQGGSNQNGQQNRSRNDSATRPLQAGGAGTNPS